MGQIYDDCQRRSVRPSVRHPSNSHISKTKQDRPVLLRNIIRKLASLILICRIGIDPSHTPAGKYSVFKLKGPMYNLQIEATASCLILVVIKSLMHNFSSIGSGIRELR